VPHVSRSLPLREAGLVKAAFGCPIAVVHSDDAVGARYIVRLDLVEGVRVLQHVLRGLIYVGRVAGLERNAGYRYSSISITPAMDSIIARISSGTSGIRSPVALCQ